LVFQPPKDVELRQLPSKVLVNGIKDEDTQEASAEPRLALLTNKTLSTEFLDEFQWACRLLYLLTTFRKAFRPFRGKGVHKRLGSYGLKHCAENLTDLFSHKHQYVSNGVMIAALVTGEVQGWSALRIDWNRSSDSNVITKKMNAGFYEALRITWRNRENSPSVCSQTLRQRQFQANAAEEELLRSFARLIGFTCRYSNEEEVTDGDSASDSDNVHSNVEEEVTDGDSASDSASADSNDDSGQRARGQRMKST
jgi:hypothetical protein